MKTLILIFALMFLLVQTPVSAQTAPKDGEKQSATDLDPGQGRAAGAGFYP